MIDTSQLEDFVKKSQRCQREMKPYAARTLDEIGQQFLDMVVSEIRANGNFISGKLAASFSKGGAGNIYRLDAGGLTLEIGSSIKYAKWVNEGHGQRPGRFVPGFWSGKRFVYVPGYGKGMVLKANFVKGSFYFDEAVDQLEELLPTIQRTTIEHFFELYFS